MNIPLHTKLVWLILLLFPLASSAQVYTLRGQVFDGQTEESIPFATVYFNKTTRGTATSVDGEFTLPFEAAILNQGSIELVISCIGYEPIVYALSLSDIEKKFVFKLAPKEELLDEIVVDGQRDEVWYLNLETFKDQFLGLSEFGLQCEIQNVDDLIIYYHQEENILYVRATAPLQIRNKLLGYDIEYLLEEFAYNPATGRVNFAGYTYFKEARGGSFRQKRWAKNRQRAYRGSSLHFLKSLYQQTLVENGFNLRKLYRVPNPNRPSEEELTTYRIALRAGGPSSLTDELKDIGSRARLPQFVQYLDTNAVAYDSYLTPSGDHQILAFSDFFQVVYTGEKEEVSYVSYSGRPFEAPREPSYQTSVVSLTVDSTLLQANGMTSNTFDLLYEGYWGWEKLGEMLPLGYELPEED